MRRIIESTDGKYIGAIFDETKPLTNNEGLDFDITKAQDLGKGLIRYSNSNYVILTEEVKDNE